MLVDRQRPTDHARADIVDAVTARPARSSSSQRHGLHRLTRCRARRAATFTPPPPMNAHACLGHCPSHTNRDARRGFATRARLPRFADEAPRMQQPRHRRCTGTARLFRPTSTLAALTLDQAFPNRCRGSRATARSAEGRGALSAAGRSRRELHVQRAACPWRLKWAGSACYARTRDPDLR